MKGRKIGDKWVVRLDKGDEIIESITKFVEENDIRGGYLTGIGAANELKIGLFDTDKKEYITRLFKGDYEIVSLSGNISIQEKTTRLHLHITIADKEQKAFGGHLYFAKIGAVCEIFIEELNTELKRIKDKDTGLYILDL